MSRRLTAIIEREQDGYAALCPEYDVVSQGASIEEARRHLAEALELFFECASAEEIERRHRGEVHVTQVEVAVGWTRNAFWPGRSALSSNATDLARIVAVAVI